MAPLSLSFRWRGRPCPDKCAPSRLRRSCLSSNTHVVPALVDQTAARSSPTRSVRETGAASRSQGIADTACHHSSRRVSERSSQSIQKRVLLRFEPVERWPLMRLSHSEYSGVCAIVWNPWPIGLSRLAFGQSVSTYAHHSLIAASPSISHSLVARKRVWQEFHIIRAWPPATSLGCMR